MATQTDQPRPGSGPDGNDVSTAQATARDAAGQAQDKAQAAAGQAQAKLREQLDQRSSQAAGQLDEQASDLRSVSQALREQGKDGPAQAADRLAGYAEKVGGYLRDRDSDALLQDAEDFGRRQPAAVAAGGLLAGFFASRFLKASSSRRYSARGSELVSPVSPPPLPVNGAQDRVTGSPPPVTHPLPAPGFVTPVQPRS